MTTWQRQATDARTVSIAAVPNSGPGASHESIPLLVSSMSVFYHSRQTDLSLAPVLAFRIQPRLPLASDGPDTTSSTLSSCIHVRCVSQQANILRTDSRSLPTALPFRLSLPRPIYECVPPHATLLPAAVTSFAISKKPPAPSRRLRHHPACLGAHGLCQLGLLSLKQGDPDPVVLTTAILRIT